MAASDHTSDKQFGPLFHGTNADLSPGDKITPSHNLMARLGLGGAVHYSYATPRSDHASAFGKHVYEVEPLDHEDVSGPTAMERYDDEPEGMEEVTSRTGFRVVRRLGRD